MMTSAEPNAVTGRLGADDDTPVTDPGPGERSGLSSVVAAELMDDAAQMIDAEAAPSGTVEDMPEFALGDDPKRPMHGSVSGEFEENEENKAG